MTPCPNSNDGGVDNRVTVGSLYTVNSNDPIPDPPLESLTVTVTVVVPGVVGAQLKEEFELRHPTGKPVQAKARLPESPCAFAEKTTERPTSTEDGLALGVATGNLYTTKGIEAVTKYPFESVTATLTDVRFAEVGVQVIIAVAESEQPGGSPVQEKVYSPEPPEGLAVKVTDWLMSTEARDADTVTVGSELMSTLVLPVAVIPESSVTVQVTVMGPDTVYTWLALSPLAVLPSPKPQLYENGGTPPVAVHVKETGWPTSAVEGRALSETDIGKGVLNA